MKELSIEEKAKAYDEARKKIAIRFGSNIAEEIFSQFEMSEDERIRGAIIDHLKDNNLTEWASWLEKQKFTQKDVDDAWLKGMCDAKHELEKQGEQKPADKKGMNIVEEDMTPFQKKVFCIIDTTIEEEHGLKQVCDELLRLAHDEIKQKPAEWSEYDKNVVEDIEEAVINYWFGDTQYIILDWLKSLKERVQPQNTWKPSDEQMKALEIAQKYVPLLEGSVLDSLYNDLKNLKKIREE